MGGKAKVLGAEAQFGACKLSRMPDSQVGQSPAGYWSDFMLSLTIISHPLNPFFVPGPVAMHYMISFNPQGTL